MRCPYCLDNVQPLLQKKEYRQVYVCSNPNCSTEIHRDYVERKDINKGFIGLVGFSGHGKTSYLTILFYLLRQLRKIDVWRDFSFETTDENTHHIIYNVINSLEKKSLLPESTPQNFPLPSLIHFKKIPLFGDYFLSFYDTAGAVYENPGKITSMGRFVAFSDVILFIISIKDCGDDFVNEMERLLDKYVFSVYNQLHINLKDRQHLIVVLTKGDMIDEIPQNTKIFLEDGSLNWYSDRDGFEKRIVLLEKTSKDIKLWLKDIGAGGFLKVANDTFKSVEYILVSSTGATPLGNELATELKPDDPKRVLDPFLWALEKIGRKKVIRKGWWL